MVMLSEKTKCSPELIYNTGVDTFLLEQKNGTSGNAEDYFIKASESGHRFASYCLLKMYMLGYGVAEDMEKACGVLLSLLKQRDTFALGIVAGQIGGKSSVKLCSAFIDDVYSLLEKEMASAPSPEFFMEMDLRIPEMERNKHDVTSKKNHSFADNKRSFRRLGWALMIMIETSCGKTKRPELDFASEGALVSELNMYATNCINRLTSLEFRKHSLSVYIGKSASWDNDLFSEISKSYEYAEIADMDAEDIMKEACLVGMPLRTVSFNIIFDESNIKHIDYMVSVIRQLKSSGVECCVWYENDFRDEASHQNVLSSSFDELCVWSEYKRKVRPALFIMPLIR